MPADDPRPRPPEPARGRRLTLDGLRALVPDLDELRPFLDLAVRTSRSDPEQTWSGSGVLGTLGARLVDGAALAEEAAAVAEAEGRRLAAAYQALARAGRQVEAGDAVAAALTLLELAAGEEVADRPEHAEAYALAAVEACRNERDRRPVALALRRAARAARLRGALDAAARRYDDAHRLARDSFDREGAAEAAIGMGNVLEQQGRWADAEAWYHTALEELGQEGDPTPQRWHALLNVHITLRSRGRIEESRAWLEGAASAAAAMQDPQATAYLENARGQRARAEGSPERAEGHLRRALGAASSTPATVVIRVNLAEALLAAGRLLEAAEEVRRAEREALLGGVLPRLPEVYRLLGRIRAREGDPEAFILFERALELIRDRALPPLEEAVTLQAYAAAEEARGDRETAARLASAAERIYEDLGIPRRGRGTWADTFGTTSLDEAGGGTDGH